MAADDGIQDRMTKLLRLFDQSTQPLDPHEIARSLEHLHGELSDREEVDKVNILREGMAFRLVETDPGEGESGCAGWSGLYIGQDREGNRVELPDPHQVDAPTIEYWCQRLGEVSHPYLKRHYAGLVWNLWKVAGAAHPGVEVARAYIDATIQLLPSHTAAGDSSLPKYQARALNLALSINDATRVEKVKRAIIDFEDRCAQDHLPGTWGQAFDELMARPKGVLATEEEANEIIASLKERFLRLVAAHPAPNLWASFMSGKRLGTFYHREGDEQALDHLVVQLRNVLLKVTDEGDPHTAAIWSLDLANTTRKWGCDSHAALLRRRYRHFSKLARHALVSVVTDTEFEWSHFERETQSVLNEDPTTSLDDFALEWVQDPALLTTELEKLSSAAPLSHMIPEIQIAPDGRPEATVGGVSNDIEGRLVSYATQCVSFSLPFVQFVFDAIVGHHGIGLNGLIDHLASRPLFEHSQQDGLLERCLGHWMNGDYVAFAHMAVAMVERAVRTLVERQGGELWRPSRHGGMNVRLLDDLLRDRIAVSVLGEDVCFHLRVVLTDSRGMNLRNHIAHGLAMFKRFERMHAIILLHALLTLALVIERPPTLDDA